MKRMLLFAVLLTLAATSLAAQTMAVGFNLGISAMTDDGVDFDDFDDTVKELWLSFDTDGQGTMFKLKAGQVESNDPGEVGAPGVTDDGTINYVDAIVEYHFSEVFGSSSLFAGIGAYQQDFGTIEESDFGWTIGANALFPVTRRFGITGEVAYHSAEFDESRHFLLGSVGVRFAF